jgi:hypothetical protein
MMGARWEVRQSIKENPRGGSQADFHSLRRNPVRKRA